MLGSKIKGARCYVCFSFLFFFFSLIEDTTSVPALEYFSSWEQAARQQNGWDDVKPPD